MADESEFNQGGDPNEPHSMFQNFQHTPIGARVPERVGRGVFSTAAMILQTNDLFVIDFLSMVVPPQQVVSRVIMTVPNFLQFLGALRVNARNYEGQFGPLGLRQTRNASGQPGAPSAGAPVGPPPAPLPPSTSTAGANMSAPLAHHTSSGTGPSGPGGQASITDFYEQLKFPEELLGGAFANAVMVRHTPEEFCFDFIANLFPRPVVASRIFMAAGRIPSFLEAVTGSLQRFQQSGGNPPPAPEQPPEL